MRELQAVEAASKKLASILKGRVQVFVDSQAAVNILKRGSMKPELHEIAENVWETLSAVGECEFLWIPREENWEADQASRNFDYDDWAVVDRVFFHAQRIYPEPGTAGADVFQHVQRAKERGLAWWVPPPVLIPKLIKGPKQEFVANLRQQVGPEWHTLLSSLASSPFTAKAESTAQVYKSANLQRQAWTRQKNLPQNENSFILYLLDKAKTIGSSALSIISAAYQTVNSSVSAVGASFVSDIIKSKRRLECKSKREFVEVNIEDVKRIAEIALSKNDPAWDRDALLAILSFHAMLRASEAAALRWAGVTRNGDLIEVKVEKAKNDQMGLGRTTFFNYPQGSDADILMCRWPINFPQRPSPRRRRKCLERSENQERLTIAFDEAEQPFENKWVSIEEIRIRGRWRSTAGLQRYLLDSPESQGCQVQQNGRRESSDTEEANQEPLNFFFSK
uniref:RNase H domain-containing protein n=1 Tax=Caenorhabditis japonica TaxID=281687 RepID=A0A8R1J098_CAEJA